MLKPTGALWLCTGLGFFSPAVLFAETPPENAPASSTVVAVPTVLATDIPPQPLAEALGQLFLRTGLQYVSVEGVVRNQQTRGAPAGLAPEEAMRRLLEGTGLRPEFLNARAARILPVGPAQPPPPPPLQEVVVRAHQIPKPHLAPASAKEQRALDAADADLETRIAREHLLYGDVKLDQYVQAVAERLLAVDQTEPGSVHVRVIKGIDPNAFALSNGSIYVTTALLMALDDEAQLAAVLGHELTHYTNGHALRALREENHKVIVAGVTTIVGAAVVGAVSQQRNHVYTVPLNISADGLDRSVRAAISGYSRELEREADDGGIRRMIAVGYDPSGALAALQHLAQQTAENPVEQTPMYASHPRIEQRTASYRDLLARELAAAAGVGERRREEYRAQLGQLPLDQVALLVEAGVLDRAEHMLAVEIATADTGRGEFLKGEIYRKRVPQTDAAVETALIAYERAATLADAPVSAYREAGLLHRMRGESDAATLAFQKYLERTPDAVDAPLVRIYLDELRTPSTVSEGKR